MRTDFRVRVPFAASAIENRLKTKDRDPIKDSRPTITIRRSSNKQDSSRLVEISKLIIHKCTSKVVEN